MALNPFKRPEPKDERWKLLDYLRPSEREKVEADRVVSEAREFLNWVQLPYHGRFMAWLNEQAAQPATITDHLTMIGQAARTDAFRTIISHINDLEKRARIACSEDT